MNIVPIQDVVFDDEATLAMGAAFDQACSLLPPRAGANVAGREIIAKRIVEAAKNGERDPAKLRGILLRTPSDAVTAAVIGAGRESPLPVYASVARVA